MTKTVSGWQNNKNVYSSKTISIKSFEKYQNMQSTKHDRFHALVHTRDIGNGFANKDQQSWKQVIDVWLIYTIYEEYAECAA